MFSQTSSGAYLPWVFDLEMDFCVSPETIKKNYGGLTYKILSNFQKEIPGLKMGCPLLVS